MPPDRSKTRDALELFQEYVSVRKICRRHPQYGPALAGWIEQAKTQLIALGLLDADAYPSPRRPMGPVEQRERFLRQLAALRSCSTGQAAGELAPDPPRAETRPRPRGRLRRPT
jgi:hypothetical protein